MEPEEQPTQQINLNVVEQQQLQQPQTPISAPAPAPATPTPTTKGKKKSSKSQSSNSNSATPSSSSNTPNRSSKGLRHFSSKVCEKVQQKQTTTYNEVANDLVSDYLENCRAAATKTTASDEKNIRRRVYDALNVLMALGIITKEKKDIHWKGYPVDHQQELRHLNTQRLQITENIKRKRKQLEDFEKQYSANYNLFKRNQEQAKKEPIEENAKIRLPFIIVHTAQKTIIECQMDEDGTDVFFDFSDSFVLHDDNEILYQLGLGAQKPADTYEGLVLPPPQPVIPQPQQSQSLDPQQLQLQLQSQSQSQVIPSQTLSLSQSQFSSQSQMSQFFQSQLTTNSQPTMGNE